MVWQKNKVIESTKKINKNVDSYFKRIDKNRQV